MQILTSYNNQARNINVLISVFGGSSLIFLRRFLVIKLAVFVTSPFFLSLLRFGKHRRRVVTTLSLSCELTFSRCNPHFFSMTIKPSCPYALCFILLSCLVLQTLPQKCLLLSQPWRSCNHRTCVLCEVLIFPSAMVVDPRMTGFLTRPRIWMRQWLLHFAFFFTRLNLSYNFWILHILFLHGCTTHSCHHTRGFLDFFRFSALNKNTPRGTVSEPIKMQ